MRWTSPPAGKRRSIVKFAWIPTHVGSCTVWLERYVSYEIFMSIGCWHETDRSFLLETDKWPVSTGI